MSIANQFSSMNAVLANQRAQAPQQQARPVGNEGGMMGSGGAYRSIQGAGMMGSAPQQRQGPGASMAGYGGVASPGAFAPRTSGVNPGVVQQRPLEAPPPVQFDPRDPRNAALAGYMNGA